MASKCPHKQMMGRPPPPPTPKSTHEWWPNQLDLRVLERGSGNANDPDPHLNYARELLDLDVDAVKRDIGSVLTDSKDFWPADYGHYGPFIIRMAWHSAGTYRVADGRGGANTGTLRFAPLNSWPDNANLDKARRLLWPVKKKYGRKISWADLMILSGNVALESMGLKTFGFAFGRVDAYAPEDDAYWGPEETWLADERHQHHHGREGGKLKGKLEEPLGAVQMGLIYVNPEGPGGNSDPLDAANDIRETFSRMAMNDVETVALIAGGHTFGKAHGAAPASKYVGPEPEGASIEEQGFGWTSKYKSGKGIDTITSGLEGAWTADPVRFDNGYFSNLFGYEWTQTKSPGGATQWIPTDPSAHEKVPDAHDPTKRHPPIMFTTDLSLRMDPVYGPISKRFHEHPEEFRDAFTRAWYKLTHRDMGPVTRCRGPEVPEAQLWQDPVPSVSHALIDGRDAQELKKKIIDSGLSIPELVRVAWASSSTYRCTDHRGGANGGRIRLAPQKDWDVNNPNELALVLSLLEKIQGDFNNERGRHNDGKQVSLADLIVLGGCAAIELAAKNAGQEVHVPFAPGRTDASQDQTDVESFAFLEPKADGFRNYYQAEHDRRSEEELLVDRAQMLTLTAPEMTVLVGGMRVLNANTSQSQLGVLTKRPESLTNDFFVNLLDMGVSWNPTKGGLEFEGRCCFTGDVKWHATRTDLVFGSNSQLRAIAEYYSCDDSKEVFVEDFVAAWVKVMNLDRFDLSQADSKHPRSRL